MSKCSVAGGAGWQAGQPGTMAFFDTSVTNQHLHVVEKFVIQSGSAQTYSAVTLESGGDLTVENNAVLNVSSDFTVGADSLVTLSSGAKLNVSGNLSVGSGASVRLSGTATATATGSIAVQPGGSMSLVEGAVFTLNVGSASTLAGGTITLDNNSTLHLPDTQVLENCTVTVKGGAHLDVDHALTLTNTTFRLEGDSIFDVPGTFTITSGSQLTVVGGSTLGLAGQNLIISANSILWCEGKNRGGIVNGQLAGVGVSIAAANITVDATSKISADGLGYLSSDVGGKGAGPGGGMTSAWSGFEGSAGAGGGYGGNGGNVIFWGLAGAGGNSYGSALEPQDLGSAGASNGYYPEGSARGGNGGGSVILSVSGTLRNDGAISANGEDPTLNSRAGGGSGGSILIQCDTLAGTGSLSAKGGNSGGNSMGGGGGGGRVAVYYLNLTSPTYSNASVVGGQGYPGYPNDGRFSGMAGQVGTMAFFDTSIWANHMLVSSSFTFEYGDDERPALITVSPGGELVLANGETWSLIDRLEFGAGSTVAVERGSRLTTGGIARLENLSLAIRNGGVLDVVGDVVLGTGAQISVSGLGLPPENNLLQNADFEEQGTSGTTALNWQAGNPDAHGGTSGNVARESSQMSVYHGAWAATIKGKSSGTGQDFGSWWQEIPASAGTFYQASAYFTSRYWPSISSPPNFGWTAANQALRLEFRNANGAVLNSVSVSLADVSTTWVQKTVSATAPTGTAWARFVVDASGAGSQGALQFDWASLTHTSEMNISGLLHVTADGALNFQTGSSLTVTGGLLLEGTANVPFGGDVFFGETGYLNMGADTRCTIKGDFIGSTKNSFAFAPAGTITFNGTGTAADPQLLEVMSADRGTAATNFTRNLAFGAVEVTNGTYLKLVNQYANVPGATSEALYAQSLVVAAGSTLDLAGFNVYVRQAQLAGTVVNGTVTQIPDSGPVTRNTGTPGTISLPGEMDEWTFYGKIGETLTVAVNTGSSWPFAPVVPQIGYVEVLVMDSAGQIVGSASSTAANQIVTVTGLTLPASGQYRVRIHAPANHSTAVGNYNVAVWDVYNRTFPVAFNRWQYGTLPTPFSEDRWTFTATVNQQIRLNSSAWGMKYELVGPGGWIGFSNVSGQSDFVTLPSSGTYTLVARGVGGAGRVNYGFTIEETTVVALPPGTSFSGSLKTMLFKIHLDRSLPLRVSARALLPSWASSSLLLQFGQPPTRSRFDRYVCYTSPLLEWRVPNPPPTPPPTQYAGQIVIPMAAAGDWYVLVDADTFATFTVSAAAGDVLIENISSNSLASNVQMDLTIKGCGFKNPAQVTLISSGGAEYTASDISVVSTTQIAASFAPNSVPAGTYSVRVSTGATAQDTLPGVLEVISNGTPKLEASMAAPNPILFRQATNASVNYGNTGNAAMPAPLLVVTAYQNGKQGARLTLDPSILGQGFWTSAMPKGFSHSVQVLGCGKAPGLLQPGEWQSFNAYYAGWEDSWDLSYPDAEFVLGKLTEENTTPIDWPSLKAEMRPPRLSDEAWDALWANFTAGVGSRWGDYVAMLNNNARYLGRIGLDVRDISKLLRFEFLQAGGLSPIKNLASSLDASVEAPGISLSFARSYFQSITDRHTLGAFGYGWTHSWDVRLETAEDGTVTILGPGSNQRTFQPDVRGGWFADKGDYGTLKATGNGTYTLQEKSGVLTAFGSDGKLDYVQDTNGNRVTATYTGTLLTRLTHLTGPWLQIDYNASGRIASITDSVGRITAYTYDAAGTRLASVQAPDTRVVSYQYLPASGSPSGHVLSEIVYPGGNHRYFTYDAAGRLGSIARDGDKEHFAFAYDTAGRVTATDAKGASTRFYFDQLGRLARTEDPLGRLVDFEFDINHNLTALIDPDGYTYDYGYDGKGNLTTMTDPQRAATKFTYTSPYSRLNLLTDANGHATRHESDAAGNLAGIVAADGSYEKWSYNAQGLPTVWRNRRGQQVSLAWDANGRLILKTFADGTKSEYSYDARGNLLSAANPSGTTGYTYNSRDELTQVDCPGGKWLKFTYDDAGRRSTSLDQLGHKLNYSYDAAGRLERMTDETNATVVEYVYDAAGRVSRKTLGNGTYTTYTYDSAGQLLELDNHVADTSVLSFFHYTYDTRGRRTAMETHYGTWTYTYDDIGQLTHAVLASTDPAIPSQDLAYTYDALGNRLRTVENGVTKNYTVNALNQYTQVGDTTYQFDADGNLVQETSPSGTTVYTYNFENRLVAVTKGGKTWQYSYDGLGNRIAVTEDGVTTKYVVDPAGLGNVVGEYNATGNLAARYDHDFGLLSRTDGTGNKVSYTFDAIGNVQQLVTSAGAVANKYAYSPFGTKLLGDETVANPFQFVGEYGVMHESNGNDYMRAREYVSNFGRFLSKDPINLAGGDVNLYRYTQDNPVQEADPAGLSSYNEAVAEGYYQTNMELYNAASWTAWQRMLQRIQRMRAAGLSSKEMQYYLYLHSVENEWKKYRDNGGKRKGIFFR